MPVTRPFKPWSAKVVRWIDADTAVLKIDLGFRIGADVTIRVVGEGAAPFDAPEIRGPERELGLRCLDAVRQRWPHGSEIVEGLVCYGTGKYGRYLTYIPGLVELVDETVRMNGGRF